MEYIVAAIEIDEYSNKQVEDFINDRELIDSIGDIFYGYIMHPSEFSKLIIANESEPYNCKLIYYAPKEDQENVIDKYSQCIGNIAEDLERECDLFLIDQSSMNKLISQNEHPFALDELTLSANTHIHFGA